MPNEIISDDSAFEEKEVIEEVNEDDLDSLWGDGIKTEEKEDEIEDKEEIEDEEVKEEEDKEEVEDEEVVEEKEDDVEEDVKEEEVKEEKKDSELVEKAREKVQARKAKEQEERRKEQLASDQESFSEDDFKDAQKFEFSDNKISVEGEERSLTEIAEEFPEVAALIKDAVAQATKSNKLAIDDISGYLNEESQWRKIESKHPGARDLNTNKEFMSWLKGQDEDVLELSKSANTDDLILVLDIWEEKKAEKVEKVVEEDKLSKARKNVLKKQKKTSSKKVSVPKKTGLVTEDDLDKIWD
ncbi:MAG: hypothetical protein ACTSYA_05680 [Candidatus Kariarchaeaceae archaeon]